MIRATIFRSCCGQRTVFRALRFSMASDIARADWQRGISLPRRAKQRQTYALQPFFFRTFGKGD